VKLQGYRVNGQLHLDPVAVDIAHPGTATQDEPLWIDLESEDPGEIETLLAHFNLHPLVLEGCVEPEDRMRVERFKDAVFLSFPTGDVSALETSYVRIVCLESALLTIHDQPLPERESRVRRGVARLCAKSVAAILLYLLDLDQDDNIRATLQLRDKVTELVDRIEDDPEAVDGGDIQALKRRTGAFAAVFEEQLASLNKIRMIGAEVAGIDGLKEYFRNLLGGLDHLVQMMQRLDRQLQDARLQYQSALQDKTNRRLNVLTIVQAVFVPASLVAGIYGMNFAWMPELQWPYAYFVTLGLMAVLGLGALLLFYRDGWFD
jgi:magnesium transporter